MDFYETDLEVVEGAFTLGEVLHTDILPLIPIRFQLNIVLKKFHYICGCQPFYIFMSEDENSDISFYAQSNKWENLRIINKNTKEIIYFDSYYSSSDITKLEISIYDMEKNYPENIKSQYLTVVSCDANTIDQSFLNNIRVNVNGKIYDKDGNIKK